MPIRFLCGGCQVPLAVGDEMAGSRMRCQRCGTVVTVPVPAAGLDPLGQSTLPPLPASGGAVPLEASPASGGVPPLVWYLVGGGVMFLLVAIGLVVIVKAFSGSEPDKPVAVAPAADTPPAAPARAAQPTNVNSFRPEPSRTAAPASGSTASGSFVPGRQEASADGPSPFDTPPPPEEETEPSPDTDTTAEAEPAAQPPASPAWQSDTFRVPFKGQEEITFGPIGCPVVIVGQDVWHIEQKRVVSTLDGEVFQRGLKALSGDGQWFAAASKSPNQQDTSIRVWHTVTGEQRAEIPGDPERFADLIRFSRNQFLLVGGRLSNEIQVWDVAENRQLRTITSPARRLDADQTAFTADGQYFTAVVDDRLSVIETKSRRVAAVMESPRAIIDPDQQLNEVQRGIYARQVITGIKKIQFSPDGQELAAVTDIRQPRLLCWNAHGKLVLDEQVPRVQHVFFFDPAFDWLPDGSGWIISGHMYDRSAKRIVFAVRTPFGDDPLFFPLDRNRLVGAMPYDPDVLQMIEIPWDQIHASLELLAQQAPAVLSPAEPVSVEVQLSGLRGAAGDTESMLVDALSKRLEDDRIRIEPGRPTVFRLRFSEKAGDTLPIYERQSPFDFRGRDTGRTATEAEGSLVVELVADGDVLWRDSFQASSSRSFDEEINDASIRKSMLETVTRKLNQLAVPYFIPKSPDHLALPVVVE